MSASAQHRWVLTAPWWHWPRPADLTAARSTAPALQKYDTPRFAEQLLADPQARLAFLDAVDRVAVVSGGSRLVPGTRVLTGLRKVYRSAHARHYLVTCALHCDAPGLPAVDRRAVCQAGFVVRRRQVQAGAEALAQARRLVRQVSGARSQLGAADARVARARRTAGVPAARMVRLLDQRAAAADRVAAAETALREHASAAAAERGLEGWVPLPQPGTGRWVPVEETPSAVEEVVHPLLPLVADPRQPAHDAAGTTVWFGTLPVGSADLTADGAPRFDAVSVYEVRCFVRRHDACCPAERDGAADCCGEVVWSEPTEGYALAEQTDLQGTSNRPVTVELPDLRRLHADAVAAGRAGGVRFAPPPDQGGPGFPALPWMPIGEVCSFAIPLITIVALFVFRLFLPIVVVLFQLWWLLLLRFCLPVALPSPALLAALKDLPDDFAPDAAFLATWGAELDALVDTAVVVPPPLAGSVGSPSAALRTQPAAVRVRTVRDLVRATQATGPVDDRVAAARVERTEVGLPDLRTQARA